MVYDVSALLARFESIEETVPKVLEALSRSMPLRSAILTRKREGRSPNFMWQPAGNLRRLALAKAHARRLYPDLGLALDADASGAPSSDSENPPSNDVEESRFLVLPLALADGAIFGALLLECVAKPDEATLAAASATVNHLSIALDRDERVRAERVVVEMRSDIAENGQKTWRFLAEVSAVLAESFDLDATLANLACLAIPTLGDVCILDMHEGEDIAARREVALSDPERYAAAGETRVLAEPLAVRLEASAHPTHGASLAAAGLKSMLVVPLLDRGKVLGSLTVIDHAHDRYSDEHTALLQEVARRTVVAIHNVRLYERAEDAVRAREELLAVVSHDLKNPLGVMKMLLSLLLRESPQREERRTHGRKQLESMARAADKMTALVSDILDSTSMSSGHFSVKPHRVDVASLVLGAVEAAQLAAGRKSIRLRCDMQEALPIVLADPLRVQQVFANLVGNAIKFTPEHGEIVVRASPAPGGHGVIFSVTDSGPGIPEADRDRLFDRFWQANPEAHLGTGLGLFIARTIVESHGGTIWVEAAEGGGSTFFFQLPAEHAERRSSPSTT